MRVKKLSTIKSFKNYQDYGIVDDGRVISVKHKSPIFLKPADNKRGYLTVGLSANGKAKTFSLHVIVAKAFCDGYLEELQVNHIDENKTNNNYKNLEWVTAKQNINHGTGIKRINALKKPVAQLTLKGEVVKIWDSIIQTKRQGGFLNKNISAVCNGDQKTHRRFNWCFMEDLEDNIGKEVLFGRSKMVTQLDLKGNVIKIWNSMTQAERKGGFVQSNISSACNGNLKTHKGFKWEFYTEKK